MVHSDSYSLGRQKQKLAWLTKLIIIETKWLINRPNRGWISRIPRKTMKPTKKKSISTSHIHTDGGSRRERHDSVHKHHHHFAIVVIVSALVGGRLRRRRRKRTRNGVVAEAEEARQLPTTRTQNAVHQRGNSDGKPKGDVLLETIKRCWNKWSYFAYCQVDLPTLCITFHQTPNTELVTTRDVDAIDRFQFGGWDSY